jgi:hypothetical protein
MFVIEYETASGEIEEMGGLFPTSEEAQLVCENAWNRYAATERFARFSVINKETRETITDFEC